MGLGQFLELAAVFIMDSNFYPNYYIIKIVS